jgi:hypothetical protein
LNIYVLCGPGPAQLCSSKRAIHLIERQIGKGRAHKQALNKARDGAWKSKNSSTRLMFVVDSLATFKSTMIFLLARKGPVTSFSCFSFWYSEDNNACEVIYLPNLSVSLSPAECGHADRKDFSKGPGRQADQTEKPARK